MPDQNGGGGAAGAVDEAAEIASLVNMIDLSKPWPLGLNRRTWPLFAIGFVVILALLVPFDHQASVLATGQGKDVVAFFTEVTRWGQADWLLYPSAALLVLSAVVAYLVPQRMSKLALLEMIEMYALIFVGIGLPSLVTNLLKHLFGRARPDMFASAGGLAFHPFYNIDDWQGFPSGHTTTAFAAAMVLGFLAPRWFGLGLLYAVAVGASRMVLGKHYPSDVFAGAVIGTLGAYAVRDVFATLRWGIKRLPNGRIVQRPTVAIVRLVRRFQRKPAR